MACVSLDLLNLVLQRLEQYPIGTLYGVDVEGFGGEALDPLLERQILVQQRMLDELDGCPVQWIGTRPFLFNPDGERPPEAIDPRLLSTYEIDVLALCRTLRRANELAGPPVAELAEGAYFIGHRGRGKLWRSLPIGERVHRASVGLVGLFHPYAYARVKEEPGKGPPTPPGPPSPKNPRVSGGGPRGGLQNGGPPGSDGGWEELI